MRRLPLAPNWRILRRAYTRLRSRFFYNKLKVDHLSTRTLTIEKKSMPWISKIQLMIKKRRFSRSFQHCMTSQSLAIRSQSQKILKFVIFIVLNFSNCESTCDSTHVPPSIMIETPIINIWHSPRHSSIPQSRSISCQRPNIRAAGSEGLILIIMCRKNFLSTFRKYRRSLSTVSSYRYH